MIFLIGDGIYCDPICLNERRKQTVINNGETLDILRCGNTNINISEVQEPLRLKKIDAQGNKIKRLERNGFHAAPNLIEIDLTLNEVDWIDSDILSGLSKLETLYLNENKIKNLQPGTFHPLDNLKEIYLEKNQIEIIQNQLFRDKEKLIRIHLDDNKIKEIQPKAFGNVRKLQLLKLRGNTCFDVDLNFVSGDDSEIQNKINQGNMCRESITKLPVRMLNEAPSIRTKTSWWTTKSTTTQKISLPTISSKEIYDRPTWKTTLRVTSSLENTTSSIFKNDPYDKCGTKANPSTVKIYIVIEIILIIISIFASITFHMKHKNLTNQIKAQEIPKYEATTAQPKNQEGTCQGPELIYAELDLKPINSKPSTVQTEEVIYSELKRK